MDTLVNDKQTYEELKRHPTPTLQRRLNSKLLSLKKAGAFDISRYYRLRSFVPQPPKLYGLPKLHKPNVPMRPIVSFCGSPTYQLSKYLWPTNDLLTEQTNIRLYPLTSLTNNTMTEITLTIQGWKCTNHWLESQQPITSWLNWPMTATIRRIYTINRGSPIHMTLKMTSTQVVETSVIVNNSSSFQNYTNPDNRTQQTKEVLFECLHHRISSTDSKVRTCTCLYIWLWEWIRSTNRAC